MAKIFLFFSEFGCGYLRVWPNVGHIGLIIDD